MDGNGGEVRDDIDGFFAAVGESALPSLDISPSFAQLTLLPNSDHIWYLPETVSPVDGLKIQCMSSLDRLFQVTSNG